MAKTATRSKAAIAEMEAQATADAGRFNYLYKVGTPVRYWSGVIEGEGIVSKTRSEARPLCGKAVVLVEGRSGCIALTHVEVIEPAPDAS